MADNNEIRIVYEYESDFPDRLRELPKMPEKIFVKGELPDDMPSVSVVGARKCSPYGRRIAYEIGMYSAKRGIQVISGMAEGIDSEAHRGAMDGGGRTFAVLGCGVDICYPRVNKGLYERISQKGGLISEYENGTPPFRYNFPARNRLISALGDVVIVVEGKLKSGSLITSDHALSQGKAVFAVPGRITDELSGGCNMLISQGAGVLGEMDDIIEALELAYPYKKWKFERRDALNTKKSGVSGNARKILELIGDDPVPASDILINMHIGNAEFQKAVFELMMKDLIWEILPQYYVRK